MDRRTELGAFLHARRARLSPADLGLDAAGGRRRVPGLRRSEVAAEAGISADYYARLEQGRDLNVSEEVLDGLARVLRLSEVERRHLHELARPGGARAPEVQLVRPQLLQVLETMEAAPALVLGRRLDVLAWNRLATRLVADFPLLAPGERNMVRLLFLDPDVRRAFPDWSRVARRAVGDLRLDAGRHRDDPRLAHLVGELSLASAEFSRWWAERPTDEPPGGTLRVRHPEAGELVLGYEAMHLAVDPDQTLVVCAADRGSAAEAALRAMLDP
ncbi:helix-turn-helix transcriptional regulator [Actinomadura parmotrematis]|uniref:Helix-turn-helix transcriptional regulator n=1 Tax=Actinomadura parmotrematis TaxID=2864039 RepID=A0ABS7FYL6_9ACTN|nr:helix-turn-helix transcriptional regulator [Actinomadura parmotrematis]MBW8485366.1 helix-turn-helix transcriptional regulator [Actinomadura parmotrematis]